MTVQEVLPQLGVTPQTLTSEQSACLDQAGYVEIRGLLSPKLAAEMAKRLDEIGSAEGDNAGKDFHTEKGTTRLGALVNKDPIFDFCFLHPAVLASINQVTSGDFGLSSMTARTALAGEGHQGFHCDFSVETSPGKWALSDKRAANALWLLDDFTPENGPTRLVPGSHKSGKRPDEVIDPEAHHPDEIYIIAPAGTLVVIDAYTWHSGTKNNTPRPRHLISAFFTPRNQYQGFADRRLGPESRARFSDAARWVLDHVEV